MINSYNFEIYAKNPQTKENGWDIVFVNVFAETNAIAREILQNTFPDFDCIILNNNPDWDSVPATENEIELLKSGKLWEIVNG